MIFFIKKFLLYYLLLNLVSNKDNILIIPFRKEIADLTNISPKNIINEKLTNNLIMSELRIGTEPQNIKLRIEFSSNLFYIASYSSLSKIKFNQYQSETYKKLSNVSIYPKISKLEEGILSSDFIYYNKTNDEKYNTTFYLGVETEKDDSGGLIGLNLDDTARKSYIDYSFINQIKQLKLINDYNFVIKYTNNYSGNLIIGGLPHIYDKNYTEEYYKDIYVDIIPDELIWNLKFEKVYSIKDINSSDIYSIDERIYGYFRIESNVLEGTESYRRFLLNTFMKENINKSLCFEDNSKNYYTYYCKDEVDITKLKNLYFYHKGLNFTFELNYNDLFYHNENDGNYYFLVKFRDYSDEEYPIYTWVLGEPIFKKYEIFFKFPSLNKLFSLLVIS